MVDFHRGREYVARAFEAQLATKRLKSSRIMVNPNGNKPSQSPLSELEALEAKVKAAQDRRKPKENKNSDKANTLGQAWRLSTELVVSTVVGLGLGYGLDVLFGTSPWMLLIGLLFGFAAGIKTVLHTAERMNARAAHIPRGNDMPESDFDDADRDD